MAAHRVERVRLAAEAARRAGVDDDQLAEPALELVGVDRVALALMRDELRRLGRLLAHCERAAPRFEIEDGARVVSVVAEEPPEPLGAAERAVGDDERLGADPGPRHRRRERVGRRERVAAVQAGRSGELSLEVDEHRSRDVPLAVGAAAGLGVVERPAAVNEAIAHV